MGTNDMFNQLIFDVSLKISCISGDTRDIRHGINNLIIALNRMLYTMPSKRELILRELLSLVQHNRRP